MIEDPPEDMIVRFFFSPPSGKRWQFCFSNLTFLLRMVPLHSHHKSCLGFIHRHKVPSLCDHQSWFYQVPSITFASQKAQLLHLLTTPFGFPDGSVVKNPPAMQEMWVQSLGQEDAWEEKMVTYSNILAWKIPWTEESGRLQSMGS